jgi:hypothetical protein
MCQIIYAQVSVATVQCAESLDTMLNKSILSAVEAGDDPSIVPR